MCLHFCASVMVAWFLLIKFNLKVLRTTRTESILFLEIEILRLTKYFEIFFFVDFFFCVKKCVDTTPTADVIWEMATQIFIVRYTIHIYIYMPKKYKHALYRTEAQCMCGCVHSFQFRLYRTKCLMTLFHWRFCDFSFAGLSFFCHSFIFINSSLCIQTHYNANYIIYRLKIKIENWFINGRPALAIIEAIELNGFELYRTDYWFRLNNRLCIESHRFHIEIRKIDTMTAVWTKHST